MSLVGSELNLVLDFDGLLPGNEETENDYDYDHVGDNVCAVQNQPGSPAAFSGIVKCASDDPHDVPTPVTGFESFFLGGISTDRISAQALAQELHQRHRPLILISAESPEDFVTAPSDDLSNYFTLTERDNDDRFNDDSTSSLDKSTAREPNFNFKQEPVTITMSTIAASTTVPAAGAPAVDADQPLNIDPAEKVYDTVKGVWGWGKNIFIFKPFMGMAEAVAGKVVETAGSSLENVDQLMISKLQGLDDGILNPAIALLVKTVLGASSKTKDFIGPILVIFLKPIDFMIKSKPENSPKAAPEVTPDVEPMN